MTGYTHDVGERIASTDVLLVECSPENCVPMRKEAVLILASIFVGSVLTGCVPSPTSAVPIGQGKQATTGIYMSDTEHDAIALAALLYSAHGPAYLSDNARNFDLYIEVRGHDPTPEFLHSLAVTGWRVFPMSAYMGHGMQVGIGCKMASSDTAVCGLGAICGPRCAGGNEFSLKSVRGRWTVVGHRPSGVS